METDRRLYSAIILWVKVGKSRCRPLRKPDDWRGLKRFDVAAGWICCRFGIAMAIGSNGRLCGSHGGKATVLTGLRGVC